MGMMAKYGEPWRYNCTPADESTAQPADVYNVALYEADSPEDLPFAYACSCCDGINISERHLERMILCVNACEGFTDDELREVAKAGVLIVKTED